MGGAGYSRLEQLRREGSTSMKSEHREAMGLTGSLGVFMAGTYSIVGEIETAVILFILSVALVVGGWWYGR